MRSSARIAVPPPRTAATRCAVSAARSRRKSSSTSVWLRGISAPRSTRSTMLRSPWRRMVSWIGVRDRSGTVPAARSIRSLLLSEERGLLPALGHALGLRSGATLWGYALISLWAQVQSEARPDPGTGDLVYSGFHARHREPAPGVRARRVDRPAVLPQEDALPAERVVGSPEKREGEPDSGALGEDGGADLAVGSPDVEAHGLAALSCPDGWERSDEFLDLEHGGHDVALEEGHSRACDLDHEGRERAARRGGGPARGYTSPQRIRNGQRRPRIETCHQMGHPDRLVETGVAALEMSLDRRKVLRGHRARHPSRPAIGCETVRAGSPSGQGRPCPDRRPPLSRATLEAPEAFVTRRTSVDVRPERRSLDGSELSVEQLRQEHQLGTGHGTPSPGFSRRSSRWRSRKIREHTVPTVKFRSRAMSLYGVVILNPPISTRRLSR